jgi:hypothetical protein
VTGGTDVAAPTRSHILERPASNVAQRIIGRLHRYGGQAGLIARSQAWRGEVIVEPFVLEEAELFGDPLLQPTMRLDDKPRHLP